MNKGLKQETLFSEFRAGTRSGFGKGWGGFIWMMKIVVPVSLATELLAWSGFLQEIDFIVQPVMGLISLPSMAALPLLIGMLSGIYGAMAAMVVLPFTRGEMTLIAIFILIAHNLIQEGVVQAKSGISPVKATGIRLIAAILTVLAVAPFMAENTSRVAVGLTPAPAGHISFPDMLTHWGATVASLAIKIFLLIMVIMIVLEILKRTGWIHKLVEIMSPLLRIMGLNRELGFLWLTAVVFGLTYGGAVIIAESKAGQLKREDLEMLHASIGINHSMVEDPSLLLSLGLSPFWLWIPRLITAVITTRIFTLWEHMSKRWHPNKDVSD